MAIQEIEKSHIVGNTGHQKNIDEGAQKMVYDILQNTQYQKPEESTVRELTANAVDSQREKEVAIDILKNGADPSKYYIQREGSKYKDSNWNPDYYDLNHLNLQKNHIELTYYEGEGVGYCDEFTIQDFGVGIGGSRLEGVLSLGYSTKRNSKSAMGAWGLGAKVALSLGADAYYLTTVHNGKKFKVSCYSYKSEFMIGKFHSKTGLENKFIELSDGTKVYYEETDELNNTIVTVKTKRHHRNRFKEAVKSQLLYFNNVKFFYVTEDNHKSEVSFLADVFYNSSNIIISDNSRFSKPHVVIVKEGGKDQTGVCYGYIDFLELEMQQLSGNIGIKCPIRSTIRDEKTGKETVLQDGVSVTPSRESVIWDDHTREFLKQQFERAVEEAEDIISEELQETDFLKWLTKCASVMGSNTSNKALSRLTYIIDKSAIKPKYPADKNIKYENIGNLFWGLRTRKVSKNNYDSKVNRIELSYWTQFDIKAIYWKTEKSSHLKDLYLQELHGYFITIEELDLEKLQDDIKERYKDNKEFDLDKYLAPRIAKLEKIKEYISKSVDLKNYDEIEVPEEWKESRKEKVAEAEKAEEEDIFAGMTPAEIRAVQNKTVAAIPCFTTPNTWDKANYVFKKVEPVIADLMEDEAEIYYGFTEDEDELKLAATLLGAEQMTDIYTNSIHLYADFNDFQKYVYNDDVKIIRISKANKKHFERFNHISLFFKRLKGNTITMANKAVKYHTARLIAAELHKFEFLYGSFGAINSEMSRKAEELKAYVNTNYNYSVPDLRNSEVMEYFDKVFEMQLFVREHENDAEAIKEKSKELFIIDDVKQAVGVDIEIYDKLQEVVAYAEPVYKFLNRVDGLDKSNSQLDDESVIFVKEILDSRNLKYD